MTATSSQGDARLGIGLIVVVAILFWGAIAPHIVTSSWTPSDGIGGCRKVLRGGNQFSNPQGSYPGAGDFVPDVSGYCDR